MAVRCVRAVWVGGLGHTERFVVIGRTMIAQFTLFELHWTMLMLGFLSQERARERSTVARTLRCKCTTV